ncbi:MAG TPA: SH3 domain-containing protein [Burkholderiales bacterium]|nr:SH3 domain-containing protein [Burkholderiales bacterium]
MRLLAAVVSVLAAYTAPVEGYAIEFRSVADEITVLYDAPSRQSDKQLILSRGYPVEVIIATDGWMRVRDEAGTFGWIESARLDAKRTVMVSAEIVDAHDGPDDSAAVVFRATKGVFLDFLDVSGGWARVKHRSGVVAFIRLTDLWGV